MELKKVYYFNMPAVVNQNFDDLNTAVEEIQATQVEEAATIAPLATQTNITTVPASFAALSDVQAYLAGANVIPNIENRLDLILAKVNEIIANLKASGAIAE